MKLPMRMSPVPASAGPVQRSYGLAQAQVMLDTAAGALPTAVRYLGPPVVPQTTVTYAAVMPQAAASLDATSPVFIAVMEL